MEKIIRLILVLLLPVFCLPGTGFSLSVKNAVSQPDMYYKKAETVKGRKFMARRHVVVWNGKGSHDRKNRLPSSLKSQRVIRRVSPLLKKELNKAGLDYGAPVFIRIFKKEKILELWIRQDKRFRLFRSYPVCTYGPKGLGPKLKQGDQMAPEGFYYVGPRFVNPFSKYHLSLNLGYPNTYDRFHKRTGGHLMIHGGCVSIGCYAMTHQAVEEIYTLSTAALKKGQPFFRVHIFPFRMTAKNMRVYNQSTYYEFWKNLKQGYDFFYQNGHVPPDVNVRQGKYVFGPD